MLCSGTELGLNEDLYPGAEHNNANIIAFGARIVGIETAKDIVKTYLEAEFMGGRHERRVAMISDIEKKNSSK